MPEHLDQHDASAVALGISASGDRLSCALRFADDRIETVSTTSRGVGVTALVADLVASQGLRPANLRELRIDLGPGSYTGLRTAVTFARLVSAFTACQVLTTTSLELATVAASRTGTVAPPAVRVVLDARRQRFHSARVELSGDGEDRRIQLADTPIAVGTRELSALIRTDEVVMADPALQAQLSAELALVGIRWVPPESFDAHLLFATELRPRTADIETLEPLYLMGSYAE